MCLDRDHSPGLDRFANQATHNATDVSLEAWGLAKDASATQEAATDWRPVANTTRLRLLGSRISERS